MTTINCSSNCLYQKDGKCSYERITHSKYTPNKECIYFKENAEKK